MSFAGKVSVVTGAAGGIGRELALQLADVGSALALCDRDEAGLASTAATIARETDVNITTAVVDVTDRSAVSGFADHVVEAHGRVDILVNNAGVAGRQARVQDYEISDYEPVIDVNLWGVVNVTHYFLPHLLQTPGSQIVNMSSIFGLIAFPETAPYAMSKFAVRAFSEALRADLIEHDISVSSVHPGVIATDLVRTAGAADHMIEHFEKHGMSAATAAGKILKGVARRKARIRVVGHTYLIDWVQRLFPVRYQSILFPLLDVERD